MAAGLLATLRQTLERCTPATAAGFLIGLSGGEDSACLLTALVALRFRDLPLRAVHVDHGLQAAAHDLRRACEASCRRLGVPLEVVRVEVYGGGSLEAAARAARYECLGTRLEAGECLVTAHHAQDQAETVLLQLLRGAGVKGTAAMPVIRAWRSGWHFRPLLEVAKREVVAFAAAGNVESAVDPMNRDLRFDRAFLRARLWPLLEQRWPGAAVALSRAAQHNGEAQALLDACAADSLRTLRDGDTLSIAGLRVRTPGERANVLRYWLRSRGVEPPGTARLTEALRQVLGAGADRLPALAWDGHALRRYRGRLFLTEADPPRQIASGEWQSGPGGRFDMGARLGTLEWIERPGGLDPQRLPQRLDIRARRGGEALRPQPRAKLQTLQHLCQAWGVLPWMRDALPLIYAGPVLVAVGRSMVGCTLVGAAGATGIGVPLAGRAAPAVAGDAAIW